MITKEILKKDKDFVAKVNDIKQYYELGLFSATSAMSQIFNLVNDASNGEIYFPTDFNDVDKLMSVAVKMMFKEFEMK